MKPILPVRTLSHREGNKARRLMKSKVFEFVLNGKLPLLMCAGGGRPPSVDMRNPSWLWQTKLHVDKKGFITIPKDNLNDRLIRSAKKLNKAGVNTHSLASQLLVDEESLIFSNNGQQINISEFVANRNENFTDQRARVRKHGFDLKVNRAVIAETSIVRVCPMFKSWELRGDCVVTDECASVLKEVFDNVGEHIGLGAWSAPMGMFGKFEASVKAKKPWREWSEEEIMENPMWVCFHMEETGKTSDKAHTMMAMESYRDPSNKWVKRYFKAWEPMAQQN